MLEYSYLVYNIGNMELRVMEKYEDNDLEEISSKKKTNKSVKRNESSKNNKNIVVRRKLSKKGIIYTSVFVAVAVSKRRVLLVSL